LTTHTTSRSAAAIAFAGAGAIALATMAPAAEFPGIAPGTALSVSLAAATDSIQAFIDDVRNQVSISGAERVNAAITVPLSDAPAHIAAGLAASAIRTVQGLVLAPQQSPFGAHRDRDTKTAKTADSSTGDKSADN
jgi:hypothetical protein